jgi:hypothetical protein
MSKSLLQVILEASQDQPTPAEIEKWRSSVMEAKKTGIPKAIATIRAHLMNQGEYELYEFIENCEWWEVQNKDAPGWHQTAAVRMGQNKVEFYYDKDFLQRLAASPSQLVFLLAHEMSHILRFHIDRSEKAKHDPSLANTAQDMIINDDILNTDKIAGWDPQIITKSVFTGKKLEKGEEDEAIGLQIPDKFREDFKDVGRKAFYYENMYNWLLARQDKEEEEQDGQAGQQEKDYFKEGSIVKVNDTGEYRKITKINDDGTFETEPVDIDAEIKKVKGQ